LTLFTAEYEKCVTQVVETFLVYFFFVGVHKPGALIKIFSAVAMKIVE